MAGPAGPWNRRSWTGLATVAGVGLAVRLPYVLVLRRRTVPVGDAFYFHYQANLVAAGHWFVNPFAYYFDGRVLPAADHPPAWTAVLAVAASLGARSYLSQLVWAAVIGAAGAAVVFTAARAAGGPGVALAAGLGAALLPDLWAYDGLLLSEALVPLTVGLVLLAAHRYRTRPSATRALPLGLACGVAALTRAELVLLIPVLALWAGAARHRASRAGTTSSPGPARTVWARVGGVVVLTQAAALLLIAPWAGYNAARFREQVWVSSEAGLTLAVANCPLTYRGPLLGYWSIECTLGIPMPAGLDGPGQDAVDRRAALSFIRGHAGSLPRVLAARLGRTVGVFRPAQQVALETAALGAEPAVWWAAQAGWYVAVALAVPGALALRRRGSPLAPLLAVPGVILVAALASVGQTRVRVAAEVAVMVMAAGNVLRLRPAAPPVEALAAADQAGEARPVSWERPGT